jgi:acyl carrier protein phosphodiesterase
MNFLAHIFLSGHADEIMIGNFIGDFVKGNQFNKYPSLIRKGIILHRKIDSYTDNHIIVKQNKKLFSDKYHKYAGILTDIFYDHFLACEWDNFSSESFDEYVESVYETLLVNQHIMPPAVQEFLPRFISNNWLKSYQTVDGIKSVLIGMSKGTSLPNEADYAILILKKHYHVLRQDFFNYFPQLIENTEKEFKLIVD